jgi:hypothetical protein
MMPTNQLQFVVSIAYRKWRAAKFEYGEDGVPSHQTQTLAKA